MTVGISDPNPHQTVAYQTVQQGRVGWLTNFAPFISKPGVDSYLSVGYYFWEHILEHAVIWGRNQRTRYPRGFMVVKCDLYLSNLFDLAGPQHAQEYIQFEELLRNSKIGHSFHNELTVSEVIGFMRDLELKLPGVFPFDSVRAQELPMGQDQNFRKFSARTSSRLILNVRYIICLFEKTDTNLRGVRVVYPEQSPSKPR